MPEAGIDTQQPEYSDSYDTGNYESDYTDFKPQSMDHDTFEARNNPQKLLHRFRLQLMNAYETQEPITDKVTGQTTFKTVVKVRKDAKGKRVPPMLNKRGVDEVLAYIEKFINGHTVQCNIDSLSEFRNNMRFIGNDIVCHFISKRSDWNMTLSDCDILISNVYNLISLFLSRGLFNEERKGYGESYKEHTNREIKPENKPNVFSKVGGFLSGKGWG